MLLIPHLVLPLPLISMFNFVICAMNQHRRELDFVVIYIASQERDHNKCFCNLSGIGNYLSHITHFGSMSGEVCRDFGENIYIVIKHEEGKSWEIQLWLSWLKNYATSNENQKVPGTNLSFIVCSLQAFRYKWVWNLQEKFPSKFLSNFSGKFVQQSAMR